MEVYNTVIINSKQNNARVAIYIRVSTLHQVDKDSIPMQRQDLLAYSKLILNTEDCVIFEDAGYSGKNTDRPKFQEMMSRIRAGDFTHLLAWKIDRISRNLLDFAAMYRELKELGVIFVSKNEQFDTSTAMGEAMLKIILVFAELERNMTSERVTSTMISRANNGLWNGGRIPYGYNYNPETHEFSINESEKTVVLLIHDMYEKERSLVRIARELNEKGYRSRAGNLWSPISLRIILKSVFYCGDYVYNVLKEGNRQKIKDKSEWITVENHHQGIISKKQKNNIIAILESRYKLRKQRNTYVSLKHVHIFGGLLYCASCGSPLGSTPGNIKRDNWSYSKYNCPTRRKSSTLCTNKGTSDPIVGEFIFNYILNMLNAQTNFSEINSPMELEKHLLLGDTFISISHIEQEGLNDLYNVLSSGKVSGAVFGKGTSVPKKRTAAKSEASKLRIEKQKTERALERIRNLYLYSNDAMSEAEYVIQKNKLEETLENINEQIGLISTDTFEPVSDEDFVRLASEFIISQKLSKRKYVNYKNLAMSVEPNVLKEFVLSIIDSIIITDGKVSSIVFKNGLCHTFIFK